MTQMFSVSSSNVAAVGYDPASQELHVEFLNKSKYKYKQVPITKFGALLTAPSVGCFLSKEIKPHFAVERIN